LKFQRARREDCMFALFFFKLVHGVMYSINCDVNNDCQLGATNNQGVTTYVGSNMTLRGVNGMVANKTHAMYAALDKRYVSTIFVQRLSNGDVEQTLQIAGLYINNIAFDAKHTRILFTARNQTTSLVNLYSFDYVSWAFVMALSRTVEDGGTVMIDTHLFISGQGINAVSAIFVVDPDSAKTVGTIGFPSTTVLMDLVNIPNNGGNLAGWFQNASSPGSDYFLATIDDKGGVNVLYTTAQYICDPPFTANTVSAVSTNSALFSTLYDRNSQAPYFFYFDLRRNVNRISPSPNKRDVYAAFAWSD
jgi:hypothetical protein